MEVLECCLCVAVFCVAVSDVSLQVLPQCGGSGSSSLSPTSLVSHLQMSVNNILQLYMSLRKAKFIDLSFCFRIS